MVHKTRQNPDGGELSGPVGLGGFSSNLSYLTPEDKELITGLADVLAGSAYGRYKDTLDATDALTVRMVAAMSQLSNAEMLGALKQYKGGKWGEGGTMTCIAKSIELAKDPAVQKTGLTSVEILLASRIVTASNANKYVVSAGVRRSVGEMRPDGARNFTAAFSSERKGDVLEIARRIRDRVTLPAVEDMKPVTAPEDAKRDKLAKKIIEGYAAQLTSLKTGVRE